jgi:hypothetical protein
MINLLNHREFRPRISNLRDLIYLDEVSEGGQLDGLHLFLSETILLLVDLLEFSFFFRGEFP